MIRSDALKRRLALVGLVVATGLAGGAVFLAGQFSEPSATGPLFDRTKADEILVAQPHGSAQWLPDVWTAGRRLEPTARTLAERAYLDAWDELSRPDRAGLSDPVSSFAAGGRVLERSVVPTTTTAILEHSHQLAVTFYSDDGSILGIHDSDAKVKYGFTVNGGNVTMTDDASYDAVLLFGDDSTWRVVSWRRSGGEGGTAFVPAPYVPSPWPRRLKVLAGALVLVALALVRFERRRRRRGRPSRALRLPHRPRIKVGLRRRER